MGLGAFSAHRWDSGSSPQRVHGTQAQKCPGNGLAVGSGAFLSWDSGLRRGTRAQGVAGRRALCLSAESAALRQKTGCSRACSRRWRNASATIVGTSAVPVGRTVIGPVSACPTLPPLCRHRAWCVSRQARPPVCPANVAASPGWHWTTIRQTGPTAPAASVDAPTGRVAPVAYGLGVVRQLLARKVVWQVEKERYCGTSRHGRPCRSGRIGACRRAWVGVPIRVPDVTPRARHALSPPHAPASSPRSLRTPACPIGPIMYRSPSGRSSWSPRRMAAHPRTVSARDTNAPGMCA